MDYIIQTGGYKMKKLSTYKEKGYTGPDASLDISLFKYGLIWKKSAGEYHFIFGVEKGENGNFSTFDSGHMIEGEFNITTKEQWFDLAAIANFIGSTPEKYLEQDLPNKVQAAVSYYGYDNIFGDSIFPFPIANE
jgi:hypothetical protein